MQDRESRLAADARVRALHGRLLWVAVLLGVTLTIVFIQTILKFSFHMTAAADAAAIKIDFRVFWAAAHLALEGEPLAAFEMERLAAVHNVAPDAWMPWLYPPGYLIFLMPFGALTFSNAFLVATLLSVVLMGIAVRPFVAGSLPVWLALTLAPAYVPTLILGQNNLIWLAGLLAALVALRDGRWILAGIFIGCLTLKPQLGLLIPVALLAAGLWRTILAATVTTILLAVLPTFYFGLEYWTLFSDRFAEHGESLVVSLETLYLMVGPLYLMALLGMGPESALLLQAGIIVVSAGIVAVLWWSDRIGYDAKVAGLLLAMLLSAPYLWYYEVAIMAVIGLFMQRAGMIGESPAQRFLLLCLWLGGVLLAGNVFLDVVDRRLIGAVLITPVLVASMAVVLIHSHAATRTPRPAVA